LEILRLIPAKIDEIGMTSGLDLKILEAWCHDAITILGATGVPEQIIKMQHDTIARHSGKPTLYVIADDCALRIGDLPNATREVVRNALLNKHGLDFKFFLDKKLKKIKAVLKRGKIKNEDEFRDLSEFATDTTQSGALLDSIEFLLAGYKPAS
jgi:hypothetical protein